MMTESEKKILDRTKDHLFRHLCDLDDEIDEDGGRIKDPEVLDGIKDAVKSIWTIGAMKTS